MEPDPVLGTSAMSTWLSPSRRHSHRPGAGPPSVSVPPSVNLFVRPEEADRCVLHGAVRCERFVCFVAHAITPVEIDQMNDGFGANDGCMNRRYPRVHGVETLQDLPSMADSTNWAFSSHRREVQQFSTATPLTSTGLPCLQTPRSMLRHAWTTAMPRVRNEGSRVESPQLHRYRCRSKTLSGRRGPKAITPPIS